MYKEHLYFKCRQFISENVIFTIYVPSFVRKCFVPVTLGTLILPPAPINWNKWQNLKPSDCHKSHHFPGLISGSRNTCTSTSSNICTGCTKNKRVTLKSCKKWWLTKINWLISVINHHQQVLMIDDDFMMWWCEWFGHYHNWKLCYVKLWPNTWSTLLSKESFGN